MFSGKKKLSALFLEAIEKTARQVNRTRANERVYAFVFYGAENLDELFFVYSTRESMVGKEVPKLHFNNELITSFLEDNPNLLEKYQSPYYMEVTACEWDYFDPEPKLVRALNRRLRKLERQYRDKDPEQHRERIEEITTAMISAIRQATECGVFLASCFEEDVLLGIQFPDAGLPEDCVKVSKAVNTDIWHKKLLDGYGERQGELHKESS